ncbi:MAG: peptide chain release factor N(5)-glutamine methyltransferase [Candidatus Andersenbacteria bacterium]
MNLRQALANGTQVLRDFRIESAELDAELLLAHAVSRPREHVYARDDLQLTASQRKAYRQLLARRASHEPVAYLTGTREFYGLPLAVSRHVLIPRPETETLVELALATLQRTTAAKPRVVDVGTGSGAIALALAKHATHARITAVDVSAEALALARRNALRLKLAQRVTFRRSDLLSHVRGPLHLACANLPYLTNQQIRELPDDVRGYEPRVALSGGPDGLFWYQLLLRQLPALAADNAVVLCEIGPNLKSGFERMVRHTLPEATLRFHDDLAGRTRVAELELGTLPV